MVEAVILLPLVLLVVMFIIWIGVTVNAKHALESSVAIAVRQAATRGNADAVGRDLTLLRNAETWMANVTSRAPGALERLLISPSIPTANGYTYYYSQWGPRFGAGWTNSLPPSYALSLVYAYEGLKRGVGEDIRYPCDPFGTTFPDGPGCARCTNLHPSTRTMAPAAGMSAGLIPPQPLLREPQFNRNWVGVACEYRPSNVLVNPLVGLITIITGSGGMSAIVISTQQFFDAPEPSLAAPF